MTRALQKHIEVHVHWAGLPEPLMIGVLQAALTRGKEIFSFAYHENWLESAHALALDPSLLLFHGPQYVPHGRENFGIFLDSSPDRWGRFLMDRREAQLAREEGRKERKLLESDYLLGVYDGHRMGALRFRTNPDGPFLDSNKAKASPPWTSLRELEFASLELEKDNIEQSPNYSKWLQMLMAPGSSLGGSRPKASVVDENNNLWIAKFPSGHDVQDIGAWEMLLCRLASLAKITMAPAEIRKFNSQHHTFLSKRFDRSSKGERFHFASAMTLLQRFNGDDANRNASYLDLAEFIMREGGKTANRDLEQLWRRIVFFICVSNVDDHLRNHGFILQAHGWELSPAYDVNPVATGEGLKLNISETDNSQDLSLVGEVAVFFRIKTDRANEIIAEVVSAVKQWRNEATALRISTREQERMARAFRVADASK